MKATINTVARFIISGFYIADGLLLMNSYYPNPAADFSLSLIFFATGGIELLSGLFLFLGYKKSAAAMLLIICTAVTALFIQLGFFELLNNAALAAGLILIINNDSGVTFLEYAQADIDNLPDYKVKL